jgi:hypothetical protein
MEQAEAFRAQKPFEDADPSWTQLTGMSLPKALKLEHGTDANVPVFTYLNDHECENLYRDSKFALYLNSGLPYTELYPGQEYRAGMSFVHLLAVPIERIYNASTLRDTDAPLLEHMGTKVCELMDDKNFRLKLAEKLAEQCIPRLDTIQLRSLFVTQYKRLIHDTDGAHMGFYFHEHPHHSVGHLHMHCVAFGLMTKSFELNEYKNTGLPKILDRLKNDVS